MAEWTIGRTILNEYAIARELGCGGMGRVWLVKSQSTGRCFAVKSKQLYSMRVRCALEKGVVQ